MMGTAYPPDEHVRKELVAQVGGPALNPKPYGSPLHSL